MLTLEQTTQNWENALHAATERYNALREAVVYAEATGGDPEMIRVWKGTLWNCPAEEYPDLTEEVQAMRIKLSSSQK